jgi:hypothetical protein
MPQERLLRLMQQERRREHWRPQVAETLPLDCRQQRPAWGRQARQE